MYRISATRLVMPIVLGVLVGLVAVHSQTAGPKPCEGPEYRQFDFWIGDWRVEGRDGKLAGTNRIERIAGGCGLQETWTAATGGGTGRSLNGYATDDGKWHQVWIGSGGLQMHLVGGLRDGSMVLEGRTIDRSRHLILQRITWTPHDDGRVRQVWEQSIDEGKSWKVGFVGMYSRTPEEHGYDVIMLIGTLVTAAREGILLLSIPG